MTEQEMTQKIETLEGRLVKAADAYKAVKAELTESKTKIEELETYIANLEAEPRNPQPTVDVAELESLRQQVKDLQDELDINGNSGEEIANLNKRLDKAKEVFATQKIRIKDLEEANKTVTENLTKMEANMNNLKADYDKVTDLFNEASDKLNQIKSILE